MSKQATKDLETYKKWVQEQRDSNEADLMSLTGKQKPDIGTLIQIGELSALLWKFTDAIDSFNKALVIAKKTNVESVEGITEAIKSCKEKNKDLLSMTGLHEKLKKNPKDIGTLCLLAEAYVRLDRHDLALEYYDKILTITPDDEEIKDERSICLVEIANISIEQGADEEESMKEIESEFAKSKFWTSKEPQGKMKFE